jgi:hypothetical protein
MRGLTQARFERVPAAAVGLEGFGVSFRMGQELTRRATTDIL